MADEHYRPTLSSASRKVIRRIPTAMSSHQRDYRDYPVVIDEPVNFMDVRRAVVALEQNGLWATPELVRVYIGKMMDLDTIQDVLTELE